MAIGEIALLKMEFSLCQEPGEPRLFQLGVVVGIEIVNANDGAAVDEQTLRNVVADKAGRSSYENRFHAIHFLGTIVTRRYKDAGAGAVWIGQVAGTAC